MIEASAGLLDLKNKLESVLFATNKRLKLDELMRLIRERDGEKVRQALDLLKVDLESRSVRLVEDNEGLRLVVKEKYLPFVRKVVTQVELPKSLLETLAVVAYKAPVLQSWVIKVRTNKAYKHLDELEELGFLTREKKGRSKLIRLSSKFFDYFEVSEQHIKECLRSVESVVDVLKEHATPGEKEELILKDEKGHDVGARTYDPIQTYDVKLFPEPVEVVEEKVGGLEVYDSEEEKPNESLTPAESSPTESSESSVPKESDVPEEFRAEKYLPKGLFQKGIPPAVEERVAKRVREIVGGKPEEDEHQHEGEVDSDKEKK